MHWVTLDGLMSFLAIVENGSINRAAHALNVSQSSLTRTLRIAYQDHPKVRRDTQEGLCVRCGSEGSSTRLRGSARSGSQTGAE
jgi:DNA-binding MurR/RpiR family transcriptional regulator